MFCQKCGVQIPDDSRHCAHCGTPTANAATGASGANSAAAVTEKIREASQDALAAFKQFAMDPIGGLPVAFGSLGKARALTAGVAFGVFFALCVMVTFLMAVPNMFRPPLLKILLGGLMPFVSISGANALARMVFKGEGQFESDIFIAGSSLVPAGLLCLVVGLLGSAISSLWLILSIFALTTTILMLYSGFTRIIKLSDRAVVLALPCILIVSFWLTRIMLGTSLRGGSGLPPGF